MIENLLKAKRQQKSTRKNLLGDFNSSRKPVPASSFTKCFQGVNAENKYQNSKRRIVCLKPPLPEIFKGVNDKLTIRCGYNFSVHFVNESHIFKFFELINHERSIYDLFKIYSDFVHANQTSEVISFIRCQKLKRELKKSFVLERVSVFICFYLELVGLFKRDVIFLKKVISLVYANSVFFIRMIIRKCDLSNLKREVNEFRNRKHSLLAHSLFENNEKLLKMLQYQVNGLDVGIQNCVGKLSNFLDEFTLDEAFNYLFDVFETEVG
jgi:hypothetical protein